MRKPPPEDFDCSDWQSEDGRVYRFGVIESYFLRIPDMQVQALLDGTPQTTVDRMMTYRDEEDLYKALNDIIEAERGQRTNFCINTLSDHEHKPTSENPDHIGVGKAVRVLLETASAPSTTARECSGMHTQTPIRRPSLLCAPTQITPLT
jgi:LmbE family N-acetylglucosaminyl deacetylase